MICLYCRFSSCLSYCLVSSLCHSFHPFYSLSFSLLSWLLFAALSPSFLCLLCFFAFPVASGIVCTHLSCCQLYSICFFISFISYFFSSLPSISFCITVLFVFILPLSLSFCLFLLHSFSSVFSSILFCVYNIQFVSVSVCELQH